MALLASCPVGLFRALLPTLLFLPRCSWLTTVTFIGPDKNGYYHEKFLRGRDKIFLAQQMPRINVKGQGPRRPGGFKAEPNLYALPFLPESKAKAKPIEATTLPRDEPPQALSFPMGLQAFVPPPALLEHARFPTTLESMLQGGNGMAAGIGLLSLHRARGLVREKQGPSSELAGLLLGQNGIAAQAKASDGHPSLGYALAMHAIAQRCDQVALAVDANASALAYVQARIQQQAADRRQDEINRIRAALLRGRGWPF
jgi:hypothetical protein